MSGFDWQTPLALELLVIVAAFVLWFKAVRAESGPKALAKIVAIILIVLALLLGVCTLTKAVRYAGECKTFKGKGTPCECCGGTGVCPPGQGPCAMDKGMASGMGKGSGLGMGTMSGKTCPGMMPPAPTAATTQPETK